MEKSERTRRKTAEIQRQLQALILYWERLLKQTAPVLRKIDATITRPLAPSDTRDAVH